MQVLRPAEEKDLDSVYELSAYTKAGLTTLPQDRKFLHERIQSSFHNFRFLPKRPGGEAFMFVLEDIESKSIIGTSAVFTKVGGFEPFWTYELRSMTNHSPALGITKEIQYLKLKKIHNGPSEIGTLFLHPDHRKGTNGRLLSLGRFLFMKQFSGCFEDSVLAEMRGYINEEGFSVFWRSLGKHFFDVPFIKADLMVNKDKSFIADLMPKHPIYVPLLPPEAQALIGKAHPDTVPAQKLLEQEGFTFQNEIDIFEAGPVMGTPLQNIRTLRESKIGSLTQVSSLPSSAPCYLAANRKESLDFRVCATPLQFDEDCVTLPPEATKALSLLPGDKLVYSPIRPKG